MFRNQIMINKDKIKAIIFDFDGVILDSTQIKTDAFRELFSDYPISIQKKILEHHNKNSGISRFEKIKYYLDQYTDDVFTEEKYQLYLERFQKIILKKIIDCNFIAGSLEFIIEKQKDFDYFIVSATPQNELELIIEKKRIGHFFKNVYGSPTKKNENILHIMSTYKLRNNELIYIGDSINDFQTCIDMKILFIGFTDETH